MDNLDTVYEGNEDEEYNSSDDSIEPVRPPSTLVRRKKRRRQMFREQAHGRSTVLRIKENKEAEVTASGVVRENVVTDVTGCKQAGEGRLGGWKGAYEAMNGFSRRRLHVPSSERTSPGLNSEPKHVGRQYRLTAKRRYVDKTDWLAALVFVPPSSEQTAAGTNRHTYSNKFLHWTFQTSFLALLVAAAAAFWTFCIIFAGFFMLFGKLQPDCIGGTSFTNSFNFADAFALSWTTFSTVGYGLIYPEISGLSHKCVLVNLFASFEAFVGVLYCGFVGALIFGKVMRIQSHATVEFSDPLVVQYGMGAMTLDQMEYYSTSFKREKGLGQEQPPLPCPVLELRVINPLSSRPGGEIMEATVRCTAVLEAAAAAPSIRLAAKAKRRFSNSPSNNTIRRRNRPRRSSEFQDSAQQDNTAEVPLSRNVSAGGKVKDAVGKAVQSIRRRSTAVASSTFSSSPTSSAHTSSESLFAEEYEDTDRHVTMFESDPAANIIFDEDPSRTLVQPRIFSEMETEMPQHPFLKRVWNIRHTLDQNSPILTEEARRGISHNGGFWPSEWNSHQKVRECIHFEEIIVSFAGTFNASAMTVYSQKLYSFDVLNIGYQFCNVLHRENHKLVVDTRLLNDVTEQTGGGAEPLHNVVDQFGNLMEIPGEIADAAKKAAVKTGEVVTEIVDDAKDVVGASHVTRERTLEEEKEKDSAV